MKQVAKLCQSLRYEHVLKVVDRLSAKDLKRLLLALKE